MIEIVNLLNWSGRCRTFGSCCGHKKYSKTIVVKWKYSKKIKEYYSGKIIPRKRRFYRKDSKGFYYIPEVSKEKK